MNGEQAGFREVIFVVRLYDVQYLKKGIRKMNILMIILGILMVLCGGSCIFTPVLTFLQTGYFLIILLLVYGIAGIIRSIVSKEYGTGFAFSIISVIAGIVIACVPGLTLMTDGMLLYMMAGWFILQGIVSLFISIKFKGANGGKKWIWGVVLGIIGILLGVYTMFHPMLLAFTMGILIGVYFVECGISMIILSSQVNK